MPATKIINVLKDDTFEEILDVFKQTPAQEVIFVLPKKSRAFSKEEHFMILNNEAANSNKTVSFLSSNPEINDLAKAYDFDVLLAKSTTKKSGPAIKIVNQIEDIKEDKTEELPVQVEEQASVSSEEPIEEFADEPEPEYDMVTTSANKKKMDDVFTAPPEDSYNLKIRPAKERDIKLDVRVDSVDDMQKKALDEIKSVWKNDELLDKRINNQKTKWEWRNLFAQKNGKGRISDSLNFKASPKNRRNFQKKIVLGLGTATVVLFGIILFVVTGSLRVLISPKSQAVDFKLDVSAANSFASVDSNFNKIPGQLFNIDKTVSQSFPATGQKEVAQKARGTITVYNEQTIAQPLVATTRFSSSSGLIFRTLKSIVVPAAKTINSTLTPGTIDVEVIADKAGSDYNVAAGEFRIVAFKENNDTVRYQKVYGKSAAAMAGGVQGLAKVVTETDFNNAKDTLTSQLQTEIDNAVKTQVAGLKVLTEATMNVGQPQSTANVDDAADNFTMTISGSIKTVAFNESDLDTLIKNYIDKTNNLTAIPEKLTINYENVKFDDASGVLSFSAEVKGDAFDKINTDEIVSNLTGKNLDQIKAYLGGIANIQTAKVIVSPFWIKKAPNDKSKISTEIQY